MECTNCSRINRMIHPDVRFFMPAPKDMGLDEITGRLAALGQNPYDTVDFVRRPAARLSNKQAIYPKAFSVEVRAITNYVAFEGAYKVITLTGAESLGDETGNVLLKLLEEPSANTVFILTTERPERILPTIFSRCQPIRFDPLVPDEIQKELVAREGLAESEAMALSRLADGSFSTARDLLHDELARAYREQLVQFLRWIWANKVDDVMKMVEELSKQTRDQIKLFLSLLIILVRDLVLVRELGPDAPIVNVDEREALIRFTDSLKTARLEQMVNLVEEAWYLVTRNVRPTLILTSLAAALRASMKGRPALPLVTPLAEQILSELE